MSINQQKTDLDEAVGERKPPSHFSDWFKTSTWGDVKKEDFEEGGRFANVTVHTHCMPEEIIRALYGENADLHLAKHTVHASLQMDKIRRFVSDINHIKCCCFKGMRLPRKQIEETLERQAALAEAMDDEQDAELADAIDDAHDNISELIDNDKVV